MGSVGLTLGAYLYFEIVQCDRNEVWLRLQSLNVTCCYRKKNYFLVTIYIKSGYWGPCIRRWHLGRNVTVGVVYGLLVPVKNFRILGR